MLFWFSSAQFYPRCLGVQSISLPGTPPRYSQTRNPPYSFTSRVRPSMSGLSLVWSDLKLGILKIKMIKNIFLQDWSTWWRFTAPSLEARLSTTVSSVERVLTGWSGWSNIFTNSLTNFTTWSVEQSGAWNMEKWFEITVLLSQLLYAIKTLLKAEST